MFLQLSLFSEVPDFPPAHLPAAGVANVMGFAAIRLAISVTQPVKAMAVMITAPTDSRGTAAAMCGATGAPIMGPWFPHFELGLDVENSSRVLDWMSDDLEVSPSVGYLSRRSLFSQFLILSRRRAPQSQFVISRNGRRNA